MSVIAATIYRSCEWKQFLRFSSAETRAFVVQTASQADTPDQSCDRKGGTYWHLNQWGSCPGWLFRDIEADGSLIKKLNSVFDESSGGYDIIMDESWK